MARMKWHDAHTPFGLVGMADLFTLPKVPHRAAQGALESDWRGDAASACTG